MVKLRRKLSSSSTNVYWRGSTPLFFTLPAWVELGKGSLSLFFLTRAQKSGKGEKEERKAIH